MKMYFLIPRYLNIFYIITSVYVGNCANVKCKGLNMTIKEHNVNNYFWVRQI